MRKLLLATAASLALGGPLVAEDKAYDAATVLATVNGHEITLGHVIALRDTLPDQYKNIPDDQLFPGLLDQIIDQELLSEKLSPSPDQDPLKVKLTMENNRRAALASEVVAQQFEGPVDATKIQAAYDATFKDFQPETEYDASHILVPSEDEAKAIEAQLKAGGDFAAIAKEKSTDTGSGAQGGELGWFGKGRMVPEFETAVVSLKVDEVSAPVKSQFGWHVIRLNGTRESTPPSLDEMRPELENQVRQEAFEAHIAELRAAAKIDKADPGVPPAAIRESDLLSN